MNNEGTEESFRKAKNIVFHLLKFRLRSERELREKLAVKSLPIPVIEQTIQYFKDLELIDDYRFALQWTSSRLKKPFGVGRIRLELKKKGIDVAIIREALSEATNQYDEFKIVAELVSRRASKYRNIDPAKVKQRVYGYLQRRGFSTNTIIKAIKNI